MRRTSQYYRHRLLWCSAIVLIAAGVLGLGRASLRSSEAAPAKEVRDANASGAYYSYAAVPPAAEKPKAAPRTDANAVSVERWIVMPVTTPLQRLSAGRDARAYVVVDGEGFRQNRVTLDCKSLDLNGLRTRLLPYAGTPGAAGEGTSGLSALTPYAGTQGAAGEGTSGLSALTPYAGTPGAAVHFHIYSVMGPTKTVQDGYMIGWKEDSPDHVTWVLQCALVGLGRYAGFSEATAVPIMYEPDSSHNWDTLLAEWKRGLADDTWRDEPAAGNAKFEVYPVRTTLSRLIYFHADCVLHVLGALGPEDLRQIEQSVAKLELNKKGLLYVLAPSSVDLSSVTEPAFHKGKLGFEQVVLGTKQR